MRQLFRAVMVMTLLLAVMMPAPGAAQKDAGAEAAVQDARLPGVNIAIRRDALDNNTPAVAYNSTRNEYLVVWTTINGETWDLTARRVGADGQLRDSYIVTSTAHIRSYQPAAVWNPASGEYLVAFASDPRDNGDFNIYASRFTPDLVQIGTPTLVSTNTGGVDWDPAVVWNPVFNQYMVVWQNYFTETNAYIRAARLKANGELIENIPLAGGVEGHPCAAADVAYNPHRVHYLVTYSWQFGLGDHDIYAQRLSGFLDLLGSEFIISGDGNDQQNPSVIAHDDEYLVTWQTAYSSQPAYGTINARRVSGEGALGDLFALVDQPNWVVHTPSAAWSAVYGYVVVAERRYSGVDDDLHVVISKPGANVPWMSVTNLDTRVGRQRTADIACDRQGSCLVVYEDNHPDTGGSDLDITGRQVLAWRADLPMALK